MMPQYVVRVELYGTEDRGTYDTLHKAMEKAGFSRTVKILDGSERRLPHAEYYAETPAQPNQVRDTVKSVLNSLKLEAGVVVTEAKFIVTDNLKQAKDYNAPPGQFHFD